MAKQIYKPGQKTPVSGQYPIVGPHGGNTGEEVTSIKGRPLAHAEARLRVRQA